MEPKIEAPEKKGRRRHRGNRGSGMPRRIPIEEIEDDDPFVDCDSQRWSLKVALDHIKKIHPRRAFLKFGFKGPVNAATFESFSNTIVVALFRLYEKLETELQNSLHMFYFGLETRNSLRFRNLTHYLHEENVFNKYPWLTTDEKLREPVDIKKLYKSRRSRRDYSVQKPFSQACKQYEIEKQKCSKMQTSVDVKIEPEDKTFNQNLFLHNVENTSQDHVTNYNVNVSASDSQIPVADQDDKHLLLSQEYNNMISAINCNYQYNSVNEFDEMQTLDASKRKPKKRSRWSSPPTEKNISKEIPILETNKRTYKLTPMMHFVNRKIKLTTETPLSLGDLIVLVSYYYKLECIEQQLLIEKMKVLEATKPNQASYLRQYVRTQCPLYNEEEIVFKPLPKELILSEINMDLQNVTCIEDILEKDFCISEDQLHDYPIANTSNDHLDDIKSSSKEFDFGSAFL